MGQSLTVLTIDSLMARPRTQRNSAQIDTSTRAFVNLYPYLISLSPSTLHKLTHEDGELSTSRAAASQGLTLTLSTFSSTSLGWE